MKKISGAVLLLLGIAAVALCLVMRSQFRTLAHAGSPEGGDFPLVEMMIPEPSQSEGAADAAELAKTISFRIYAIGGVGAVLVIGGLVVFFAGGRKRRGG